MILTKIISYLSESSIVSKLTKHNFQNDTARKRFIKGLTQVEITVQHLVQVHIFKDQFTQENNSQ